MSTGSEGQKNSFENQKDFFENYFKNTNYELTELYADQGEDANDVVNRDRFLEMIKDAGVDYESFKGQNVFFPSDKEPLFNEIYITNSSRFSRNIEIISLLRILWKKGVYVLSLDGNLNTRDRPDDFRTIIDMGFNQMESLDKSRKVRAGHQRSARRGKLFGLTGLYGYDYNPMTKEVKVSPDEADTVKLIYNLYLQGLGEQRIANFLEENKKFTRKGQPFKRTTIRKILTNEKYYGALVRNKVDQGTVFNKYKTHKIRPSDEWIITEDKFEPIITKDTFKKAQEIRATKVSHETQKGRNYGKTEFASRIICSICGKNYVMCVDKNRYYACSTKRTKGAKTCGSISVRLTFLENYIQGVMKEGLRNDLLSIKQNDVTDIASEIKVKQEALDLDKDRIVAELKQELGSWKQKSKKLALAFAEGGIEEEDYLIANGEYQSQIYTLQEAISENSKTNEEIRLEITRLFEQLDELNNVLVKESYTREEVVKAIINIKVTRNKRKPDTPQLSINWDYSQFSK